MAETSSQVPLQQSRQSATGIPDTTDVGQLWQHFTRTCNIFYAVEMNRTAGFHEIAELMSSSRYISALMSVIFLAMNIYYLLVVNGRFVAAHLEYGYSDTVPQSGGIFLLSTFLLNKYTPAESFDASIVVALIEFCVCLGIMLWFVYLAVGMTCARTFERRWIAIAHFWWNAVPSATAVSAVRLLNFVTPSVVSPQASLQITLLLRQGCGNRGLHLLWFLLSRLVAALLGFDAFLFKFQILALAFKASMVLGDGEGSNELVLLTLVFLNQMLGIVQVAWFTRQRIFTFVFAGELAVMTPAKQAAQTVWEAMLAWRIWNLETLRWHEKLAICLTFSDVDLQRLVLKSAMAKEDTAQTHKS